MLKVLKGELILANMFPLNLPKRWLRQRNVAKIVMLNLTSASTYLADSRPQVPV